MDNHLMDDQRFIRLEALAKDPNLNEGALYDLVLEMSSDIVGMRSLVKRYAESTNFVVQRYVSVALARAPRDWKRPDGQLNEAAFTFLSGARNTDDAATLNNLCTALQELSAIDLLDAPSEEDKQAMGEFLLSCLSNGDSIVQDAGLYLMRHLWADGVLNSVLSPAMTTLVKGRLAEIAAKQGDEFRNNIEFLRPYWEGR